MSLLLPDSGLLFWMLVSFGIVFAVLGVYGFPIITGMVSKRKAYIDQSLTAAKAANDQLADLHAQADAILNEAQGEQARILNEAKAMGKQLVDASQQKAREESQRMVNNAKRQIEAEREETICEVRREMATLSVQIAEKVLRQQLADPERQMQLIGRMLDELKRDAK